jgi:hypothetical protein
MRTARAALGMAGLLLALACGGAKTTGGDPGAGDLATGDLPALDAADAVDGTADRDDPGTLPPDTGTDLALPPDEGPATDLGGSAEIGVLDCALGGLKGVTCAPNQQVKVAYADVTLTVTGACAGTMPLVLKTQADAQGNYAFTDVPPGDATLAFQKGSYKGSVVLTIVAGHETDLTGMGKRCFQTTGAAKLAVVQGTADQIGDLLTDLGFEYDAYSDGTTKTTLDSAAHDLMADATALAAYDVLFINCSATVQAMIEGDDEIPGNLKAFVEAGKSLYASDWAWAYIEKAWPGAIDFYGVPDSMAKGSGDAPDKTKGPRQGPGPTLSQKEDGAAPFTLPGQIVDSGLEAAMGKTTFTIYHDLGTWVVIEGPGTGTTAVQAKIDGTGGSWGVRPQVVSFQPPGTKGHVIFTSFHNIAQQDAGGNVDDIKAILSYLVFSL